ncbi:MAG: ThiF family adenylyltransferase [Lentisphaeria bacterium]|nr:ThiF family adenylyltransferase [Lentisphaeria bacterium]
MMDVRPWYERYSGLLDEEISAFKAAGMAPELDLAAKASGKAVVGIRVMLFGTIREGCVTYPDLYPYYRPSLDVEGITEAKRHYNPFSGNICLLRRGTQYWAPENRAASLIIEQRREWEKAARRSYSDERLATEDQQAEPISAYLHPTRQQVFVDSSWQIPEGIDQGNVVLMVPKVFGKTQKRDYSPLWAIQYTTDSGSQSCHPALIAWVKDLGYKRIDCPWCRIETLPTNPKEIPELVKDSFPKVHNLICNRLNKTKKALFALRFPEEDPHKGIRDGWLFIHVIRKGSGKSAQLLYQHMTVEYTGEGDIFERIPELNPLRQKKVAIVGLGCVGAPSVLALAQAGTGELRLLDSDHVSPGTICRWPLGFQVSGKGKGKALADFITANYPFTRIGTQHYINSIDGDFRMKIGAIGGDVNQLEVLDKMLEGVDLLYDASTEQGVNHLLCDLARERGIPYITASSRAGGWGGNVVRVRSDGKTGCYLCYLKYLEDGEFEEPPYDPEGDELQPVGCGDLTFKAAGFDVQEVALAGVRMAVSTLCEGQGAYPLITGDVGILRLRVNGTVVFPEWCMTFPPTSLGL